MVYKSVNGLAPQYLHDLFIRNIENPSYELRKPLLTFKSQSEIRPVAKRESRSGEPDCGTASQLS